MATSKRKCVYCSEPATEIIDIPIRLSKAPNHMGHTQIVLCLTHAKKLTRDGRIYMCKFCGVEFDNVLNKNPIEGHQHSENCPRHPDYKAGEEDG